jgi:hypothetical protein
LSCRRRRRPSHAESRSADLLPAQCAAVVDTNSKSSLDLKIKAPADAEPGQHTLLVKAAAAERTYELPVTQTIELRSETALSTEPKLPTGNSSVLQEQAECFATHRVRSLLVPAAAGANAVFSAPRGAGVEAGR